MPDSERVDLESDVGTLVERRRPGRIEDASSELIPLLRNPVSLNIEATLLDATPQLLLPERFLTHRLGYHPEPPDDLRAARGVLISIAISLGFWLSCFLAMALLVRG